MSIWKFEVETEQQENSIIGVQLEALKENVDKDNFQELPVQIKAEDEKLERLSISESQQMDFWTGTQMEITCTFTAKRDPGEC